MATNLVILLRTNPDVVAARMKRQPTFAKFEKVMLPLFFPPVLAIPIVAGLDAVRHAWAVLPPWAMWPGVILHFAGDAFSLVLVTGRNGFDQLPYVALIVVG